MAFKMIDYLLHISPESFEIDLLAYWGPPEMKVALLNILRLNPLFRSDWAPFLQYLPHKLAVVPGVDLVSKDLRLLPGVIPIYFSLF